jgi:hypothetical protein
VILVAVPLPESRMVVECAAPQYRFGAPPEVQVWDWGAGPLCSTGIGAASSYQAIQDIPIITSAELRHSDCGILG